MPKIFYWQDVIGNGERFKPYQTEINQLIAGEYVALSLEKLNRASRTPIYSIRINVDKRILFTTYHGKICLLDVVLNHDYHKSRFLKYPAILNAFLNRLSEHLLVSDAELHLSGVEGEDFVRHEGIEGVPMERGNAEPVALYHYQKQMIEFSETQDNVLCSKLPLVITGPAGSGKSCVAMSMLTNYVREHMDDASAFPIVYAARSPHLVAFMQKMWRDNLTDVLLPEHVDIQFKTITDLFIEQALHGWELAEDSNFSIWYAEHLTHIKSHKKLRDRTSPTFDESKDDVWREFRVISGGFDEAEYIRLGEGQSTVPVDRREFIFDCYKAYISYLAKHRLIQPELANLFESNHKLAIIDEAQDLSYGQLSQLNNMASEKIVYMLGEQQILFDGLSRLAYLKQHFHRLRQTLNIMQLSGTYRSAQRILDVANIIIGFKYQATGGATDKGEITDLRTAGDMEGVVGETLWLSSKNTDGLAYLRDQAEAANLAVISWSERGTSEARTVINTPLVFTPEQVKGLEYDTIILWDPFASEDCSKACKKLRIPADGASMASGAGHLAKNGESDVSFLPYFNALITAITRARKKLFIVHSGSLHTIEPMVYDLSTVFTSLKDGSTHKKGTGVPGVPALEAGASPSSREINDHWLKQAGTLISQGLEPQAREIIITKLGMGDAFYERYAEINRVTTSSKEDTKASIVASIAPKREPKKGMHAAAISRSKSKLLTLDEIIREERRGKLQSFRKFNLLKSHLEEDPSCITNSYVRLWLKESLSINNPTAVEQTLLYWFVSTEAGRAALMFIVSNSEPNNDLLQSIPLKAWGRKASTGRKSDNLVLLHLLVTSNLGCDILYQLLTIHPNITGKIQDYAWKTTPTTGDKVNISTLLELQLNPYGKKIIRLLKSNIKYKSIITICETDSIEDKVFYHINSFNSSSTEVRIMASLEIMNLSINIENKIKIAAIDEALEGLVKLLDDPVDTVRINASKTLEFISIIEKNHKIIANTEGALEGLVKLLNDSNTSVIENAIGTFMSISMCTENEEKIAGIAGALEAFSLLLHNSNARIKEYAAGTLMNLGCNNLIAEKISGIDGILEILVKLLRDYDVKVKACALGALRNLSIDNEENSLNIASIEGALEDIVKLLRYPHEDIKEYSTECLMYLAYDEENQEKIAKIEGSLESLVLLLNDYDTQTKECANFALTLLARNNTANQVKITSLVELLLDSDTKAIWYQAISRPSSPTSVAPASELSLANVGRAGFFSGNSNIESERPPVTSMELLHD